MKLLHLDTNHPLLIEQLNALGIANHEDYSATKDAIEAKIKDYDGIVIRSRFTIDKQFLDAAKNLKCIARVGAGLENIDTEYATQKGIHVMSAPEGNRNAVGEHTLALLLSLSNKLTKANAEIRRGKWQREANRGVEIDGKTIGLIGYGNMGKAFAKKLRGFDVDVLCYDIKQGVGDANAKQVSLETLQQNAQVLSLHTPQTPLTINMVNQDFINAFKHPFWFINTARGKSVVTTDLVEALVSGKVLGAGLDVLEYEKSSFEDLFKNTAANVSNNESSEYGLMRKGKKTALLGGVEAPAAFQYLMNADNVVLTPHVAGWTVESKEKLAQTIVDKIKAFMDSKN